MDLLSEIIFLVDCPYVLIDSMAEIPIRDEDCPSIEKRSKNWFKGIDQ
jgi:hypothetical protein